MSDDGETSGTLFAEGLKIRRAVLGPEYVDGSIGACGRVHAGLLRLPLPRCAGVTSGRGRAWMRRTRSLLTLALLTALKSPAELKLHVEGSAAQRRHRRTDS